MNTWLKSYSTSPNYALLIKSRNFSKSLFLCYADNQGLPAGTYRVWHTVASHSGQLLLILFTQDQAAPLPPTSGALDTIQVCVC